MVLHKSASFSFTFTFIYGWYFHLATSEMWCWSGGRGI